MTNTHTLTVDGGGRGPSPMPIPCGLGPVPSFREFGARARGVRERRPPSWWGRCGVPAPGGVPRRQSSCTPSASRACSSSRSASATACCAALRTSNAARASSWWRSTSSRAAVTCLDREVSGPFRPRVACAVVRSATVRRAATQGRHRRRRRPRSPARRDATAPRARPTHHGVERRLDLTLLRRRRPSGLVRSPGGAPNNVVASRLAVERARRATPRGSGVALQDRLLRPVVPHPPPREGLSFFAVPGTRLSAQIGTEGDARAGGRFLRIPSRLQLTGELVPGRHELRRVDAEQSPAEVTPTA